MIPGQHLEIISPAGHLPSRLGGVPTFCTAYPKDD